MVRKDNYELVKPPLKLRQVLLKTAKNAIKRPMTVTLIKKLPTAIIRLKISHQAPETRYTIQNTQLHSYSLRDIENSTDWIIGEPLANATPVSFSFIIARNVTLS